MHFGKITEFRYWIEVSVPIQNLIAQGFIITRLMIHDLAIVLLKSEALDEHTMVTYVKPIPIKSQPKKPANNSTTQTDRMKYLVQIGITKIIEAPTTRTLTYPATAMTSMDKRIQTALYT